MKAITLRIEPSVRQTEAILARIEQELVKHGARVTRQGVGGLRFRMPVPWPPWRALRLGRLWMISAGRVKIAAGSGGPWQVLYELDFSVLSGVLIAISLVLVIVGWSWPSRTLLYATLLGIWLLLYLIPHYFASRRFQRVISESTREVVERRRTPRATPRITGSTGSTGSTEITMERPIDGGQKADGEGRA